MTNPWTHLPDKDIVNNTITALKNNGINAFVVSSQNELKQKIAEIIPPGSEVMTMSSQTLETTGLTKEFNESDKYVSIRQQLSDKSAEAVCKANMPNYAVGSVQAVVQDGQIVCASATGSQMASYVYGAKHVVWVVGTHKIVSSFDQAMARIKEYVFPLEDKRALAAYGIHSGINKVLVISKEVVKERLTLIFINEKLGF